MASKLDKLIEDMKAEETSTPNNDTAPVDTPPSDTTPAEPNPEDTPKDTTPANPEEPPKDTPSGLPFSEDKGAQPHDEHKPSPAEFAFKRQLSKQAARYEKQIEELNASVEARVAEAVKKALADAGKKDEPVKTREDFPTDDEYIAYLTQRGVEAALGKRDAESKAAAEQKAKQDADAQQEQKELAERQQNWLSNVDSAFNGDNERKTAFLKRVQFCVSKGLGEILDNVPVAADFLMNNPRGPIVFEKILSDRDAFAKVFTEHSTPLDIYYELRALDKELSSTTAQPAAPAQTTQMPHLGKPGKQASSNSAPDIFSDPKAMKAFLRSH